MARVITLKDNVTNETLYPQINAASLSAQTDAVPTNDSENFVTSGGVKSFIDSITQTLNFADFSVNGYIDANGVIKTATAFRKTDYIRVLPGEAIGGRVFTSLGESATYTTCYVAFYTEAKVFVQGIVSVDTGMKSFSTIVPDNCYYVIFSTKLSNLFESYVILADNALISKIGSIDNEVQKLSVDVYNGTFIIVNGNLNIGGYLKPDGTFGSAVATSWAITDYIEITPSSEINAALAGQIDTTLLAAFYDANRGFISGVAPTVDLEVETIAPSVPNGAKYVVFCTRGSSTIPSEQTYCRIQNPNFATRDEFDSVATEVNRIKLSFPTYQHNLHKPFSFNGKRAVFFGDSVTYGVNSDAQGVHTDRTNCWRRFFCDIAGLTGANQAISGSCICDPENAETSIMNKILDNVDSSSNYDYIFIAGGVNDYATGSPLGNLNSASTYTTFYGSLKVICDHLTTVLAGKNTQVIFLTPINYSRIRAIPNVAELNDYRTAIFEIATMYGFNVLDTSVIGFPVEYTDTPYKQAVIYDGVHPTIAGHKMMAQNIYSLLI